MQMKALIGFNGQVELDVNFNHDKMRMERYKLPDMDILVLRWRNNNNNKEKKAINDVVYSNSTRYCSSYHHRTIVV